MPMRVLATVTVMVLLTEALLGFAFFAGYHWLGGWETGVVLSAALLLLILLPWLGALQAQYDSADCRTRVRLGWWGAVEFRGKEEREVTIRVLGIPWRKRLEARPAHAEEQDEPEDQQAAEARQMERGERRRRFREMAQQNFQEIARVTPAALQVLADMLWEAQEIRVEVNSPTGNDLADTAIAGVVAHRGLGPVDLKCSAQGERRVRVTYKIGMLRAVLTVFYLVAHAGPCSLMARIKAAKETEGHGAESSSEPREAD